MKIQKRLYFRESEFTDFVVFIIPVLFPINHRKYLCSNENYFRIIKDEANEPLIGVTVQIKGTNTVLLPISMVDILVAAATGNVLVFTYVGMQTQEVTVGSQASIDVVMKTTAGCLPKQS